MSDEKRGKPAKVEVGQRWKTTFNDRAYILMDVPGETGCYDHAYDNWGYDE